MSASTVLQTDSTSVLERSKAKSGTLDRAFSMALIWCSIASAMGPSSTAARAPAIWKRAFAAVGSATGDPHSNLAGQESGKQVVAHPGERTGLDHQLSV